MSKIPDGAFPCRVCHSEKTVFLYETGNEHSKTRRLSNLRCADCGSVFIGDPVDAEELSAAYSTLDTTAYYGEIDCQNRTKMAKAIRELQILVSKSDSLIDIGTGDGLFIRMLREAGFENVSAHEIAGADLLKIAGLAQSIYQDFDYSTIPDGAFDAVTLLDVVEHVMDPQFLMKTCHRILRPQGVIYFHTPVVTRTDRFMHSLRVIPGLQRFGAIWQRGRTSIFHLANYTPKSLTLLLTRAGFNGITVHVENELSWPVGRYVRQYLIEKQRLPSAAAPLLTPLFYPLLATDLLNANKGIVSARKA